MSSPTFTDDEFAPPFLPDMVDVPQAEWRLKDAIARHFAPVIGQVCPACRERMAEASRAMFAELMGGEAATRNRVNAT